MKESIRVIYKRVGFDPVEVMVPNTLEHIQMMVGGYVEAVPWYFYKNMQLLCDEEGKLDRRPVNFIWKDDAIVGSVMWVGEDGEDFDDCPYTLTEFRRRWPWLFEEEQS